MTESTTESVIPAGEMFSTEEKMSREQLYEKYISDIMKAQHCSRGKAKRVLESLQRKTIKKFRASHFKNVMEAQKRRDLGIADPAPLTVDEAVEDVQQGPI